VAMTQTQVPIIMWERRYMTPTECKRLQSLEDLHFLPDKLDDAYAALGNAVNVHVAQLVAEALVGYSHRRADLEHQRIRPGEPLPAIQSPLQFTSLRGME
jgi:hypothetical protein